MIYANTGLTGYLTLGETESLSSEIAGGFQEVLQRTKIFKKL
jgi:hypothetical protein